MSLRIVYFGTPAFAVPTLEALLAGPHDVVGVVSQPDRQRGRGRRVVPSPVSEVALRRGLALLRPERVGEPESVEAIRALGADLGVVVAFGQFLTKRVREAPALGYLVNGHASLLPKYRGAAPIARAILAGETWTGVSVMRVEREMDAGPVALERRLAILPDETAGELSLRLAALTAEAVSRVVDAIAAGDVHFEPQDASLATEAPKIERAEARLDWREPAEQLVLRVRALSPSPGAHTQLSGDALRILKARAEAGPVDASPGTVRRAADGRLRIATGDGWLVPLVVQRAGGRALDTDAFLRGRDVPDGTMLGNGSTARVGT